MFETSRSRLVNVSDLQTSASKLSFFFRSKKWSVAKLVEWYFVAVFWFGLSASVNGTAWSPQDNKPVLRL